MKPFFILSLPRSRTAWLANFLTYGESFCFHEALIERKGMRALQTRMEATGCPVVGNSDSGSILFYDELQDQFPEAKCVIVLRNPEEVVESLSGIGVFNSEGLVELAYARLLSLKNDHPTYYFDSLGMENCKSIYEYLTEQEFNPQRWELLNSLMIEVNVDFLHKKIMKNKDNLGVL